MHALESDRAVMVIDGDGREAIQLRYSLASEALREAGLGIAVSARSILAFIKTHNQGDKLHYEIPMAGDGSAFARHRPRNFFASRVCSAECACHRPQASA
jgi:hypothetical protein